MVASYLLSSRFSSLYTFPLPLSLCTGHRSRHGETKERKERKRHGERAASVPLSPKSFICLLGVYGVRRERRERVTTRRLRRCALSTPYTTPNKPTIIKSLYPGCWNRSLFPFTRGPTWWVGVSVPEARVAAHPTPHVGPPIDSNYDSICWTIPYDRSEVIPVLTAPHV